MVKIELTEYEINCVCNSLNEHRNSLKIQADEHPKLCKTISTIDALISKIRGGVM
ncbi:MAG: hypothetical protein OEL89_00140 [Candidatus Peregrinibacteria bacterium]|nr:hypothetical protein [Candidatus Peregrinibacteria bacterium]